MTIGASLSGHRATVGTRLQIGASGVWWAEVSLDVEAVLTGRVALVLADMTLSGTVMAGGVGPVGRSRYRIAGGAGQWGKTVPAKAYANDAGVKASTVLVDVAAACGESIDPATLPTERLGAAYVREEGPAARVLEQVAAGAWYVNLDGVTKLGRRVAVSLKTAAPIQSVNRARGVVRLAPESVLDLVPGVVVDGLEAVDVMHEVTAEGIRSTLWTKGIGTDSRQVVALRRLLEQIDPDRRYRATYEYRVVTQDGERANLQPLRVSAGMPDLQRVPIRPGVSGARADVALGSRVLVTFVDADPARPVVVGFEDADGGGFVPIKLKLDATAELNLGADAIVTKIAGGTLPIARQTDPVVAGPFAGTITVGSLRGRCG